MRSFFPRRRSTRDTEPTGVRVLIFGEADVRGALRIIRSSAKMTGTVGWARSRSDLSIEVLAHHPDGLARFQTRCFDALSDSADIQVERLERTEVDNEVNFRIRREKFLVSDTDLERYSRLGIDTDSRQFSIFHTSGHLENIDVSVVESAQRFWQTNWGTSIDTALHAVFANVCGFSDDRIVPPNIYRTIWRFLNPGQNLLSAYSDKNLFGRLVATERQPEVILSCIDGRYYDSDARWLRDNDSAAADLLQQHEVAVIKPTRSDNGYGVEKLVPIGGNEVRVGDTVLPLKQVARKYRSNFVIQAVVEQHETMAHPHPPSVNTLRIVTLRWAEAIHHLLTFARFGSDGRINDNAGTGGVCVGVDKSGRFERVGIDGQARQHEEHPTSGVRFESLSAVPNFSTAVDFAKRLHERIPYFDLLSWDIAIGRDGEPILIECNFRGAVWLYQLATRTALFGELTEDILHAIR